MMGPTPLLYVPAGHPTQAVAVADVAYWPAAQLIEETQADPDLVKPALHAQGHPVALSEGLAVPVK
jgi:hypothetical protein